MNTMTAMRITSTPTPWPKTAAAAVFIFHLISFFIQVQQSYADSFSNICNDGWQQVDSGEATYGPPTPYFCLRKSNFSANWTEALESCRSNGAHLLVLDSNYFYTSGVVTSATVNDVMRQIHDYLTTYPVVTSMWVGVHVDNGKLFWEADLPIRVKNSSYPGYNWTINQPSAILGECGAVLNVSDTTYNPLNRYAFKVTLNTCSNKMNFSCVKAATRLQLQSLQTICPGEWLGNYDSGMCYWMSSSAMSFLNAQRTCVQMNGTLAQPTDNFSHRFITSFIDSAPIPARRKRASAGIGSTIWIGLYVNRTTVDGFPWTYTYNGNTRVPSTSATQCISIVSSYSLISWVSSQCNTSLPFVCQRPIVVGDVSLDLWPKSDSILTSNYTNYQVTCDATNYHPELPVVWVKDGIYINVTQLPPQGFALHLSDVLVALTLSTFHELQGYYHCEVWSLTSTPHRFRIKSDPALITFSDVATYHGLLEVQPGEQLLSTAKVELCNVTYCQYLCCTDVVFRAFPNAGKALPFSYYVTSITDAAVRFTMYVDLPLKSDLLEQSRLDQTSWRYLLLKNLIYTELLAFGGANVHDGSLTLAWSDACVNGFDLDSFGFVGFPFTMLGHTATSFDVCVTDGQSVASGVCTGSFTTGAYWQVTLAVTCTDPSDMVSPTTVHLRKLSQTEVTFESVSNIVSSAAHLTNQYNMLTSYDVTYASVVLRKVAALPIIKPELSADFVTVADNIASVKTETLHRAQNAAQSTTRILTAVDEFSEHVDLNESRPNVTVVRPNIVFQVYRITKSEEGYGLIVDNATWHTDSVSSAAVVNVLNNPTEVQVRQSTLSSSQSGIFFSSSALSSGRDNLGSLNRPSGESYTVSCNVYQTDSLFNSPVRRQTVNSLVMSGSINGVPVRGLTEPMTIVFQLKEEMDISELNCSYWGFDSLTNQWKWLTEGVWSGPWSGPNTDKSNSTFSSTIVCYSRHLTNFAVIAGYTGDNNSTLAKVLEYISIIGLSLSIAGLVIVILSVILFRAIKKGHSQLVLVQLAIALLAVDILVLSGIDKTNPVAGCKAVAALLLYFLLVAFSWMLVEAVIQYMKFVKVFNTYTSRFMLKAALPAWIGPGIIVAIVAIVDSYGTNLLRGPVFYCWLAADAFHFAFLLPLGLIMVVNIIMFVLVVKGITCDRPKGLQSTQNKGELVKLQVQTAIGCFLIMGLTWLFAFFAVDQAATTFQILFCIFNSLQGFLIFLLLIVRDKPTRDAWQKLFCRCVPNKTRDARVLERKNKKNLSSDGSNKSCSNHEQTVTESQTSSCDYEISTHNENIENVASLPKNNARKSDINDISEYKESPADVYMIRCNSHLVQ